MGFIAAVINLWWVNIYLQNRVMGLIFLTVGLQSVRWYRQKRDLGLVLIMVLLMLFQLTTTNKRSLTLIANDDRRLIDLRLSAYPPITFIPIAHWLEQKEITIATARILESLFENLDPNQYFFANHPRERPGYKEFQKFLFIYLPFAVIGLVQIGRKKTMLLWVYLMGLGFLSLVGNKNQFGNIMTYPLLLVAIEEGGSWLRRYF